MPKKKPSKVLRLIIFDKETFPIDKFTFHCAKKISKFQLFELFYIILCTGIIVGNYITEQYYI